MATQEDYICRVESGFLIKISDRLLYKHGSDILHGVQWKKPGTMHASVSLSYTETSAVYSQHQAGACVNIVKKIYA